MSSDDDDDDDNPVVTIAGRGFEKEHDQILTEIQNKIQERTKQDVRVEDNAIFCKIMIQEINNIHSLCIPSTFCIRRRQGELARRCGGLSIGGTKILYVS
uniref:Uncharacterized protein n=1 Tax=Cacopsylla melanoneura TaxID=428564 RepID=A0A8D8Z310_9HEMI